MLFRKRKVQAILDEYERIYNVKPTGIGVEEQLELQTLALRELALAYDSLGGIKYFEGGAYSRAANVKYNIPDWSGDMPSTIISSEVSGIARRLRTLKNRRVLEQYFDINSPVDPQFTKVTPPGATLWKNYIWKAP